MSDVEAVAKPKALNRLERRYALLNEALAKAQISGGRMLEIGGRRHPTNEAFPQFDYVSMDISQTSPDVLVGDITKCPELEDKSFDVIVSFEVFEHISKPWLAAAEMMRLLRPGGLTVHTTVFSWRYHPVPKDYWRFTPSAMKVLFDGMTHIVGRFDDTERRRDLRGASNSKFRLEPDKLGGWRENWLVNYAGIKPSVHK